MNEDHYFAVKNENSTLFTLHFNNEVKLYLLDVLTKPYLRLDVTKGGCSGFYYKMAETETFDENDYLIELNDKFSIVVNKEIGSRYLNGVSLLLETSAYGQNLKFKNPNALHSCGCGESFDAK
jgi:iron-sulfur cluster assembly protein